jgi:NAD(P)-dependent dehydrogenase (short-subunit alcohol dehydrogenase family)
MAPPRVLDLTLFGYHRGVLGVTGIGSGNHGRRTAMAGPRLTGKVAIVTGAGSRAEGIGNGRATAVLFAREGARVLCVDREKDKAEATRAMIAAEGGEAAVLEADVTRSADCRAMVDEAVRRWGRLDILDNNVGIGGRASVVEVEEGDWDHMMRVNVTSMMLTSKHAIPAMAKGGGGAIVNISSISALRPRGLTPYTVSKGAVIALTRAMAIDHAAQGIRVNCIAPGPVYTPMVYAGGMTPELRDQRRRASPLGIEGTGWDIANAAVFLASDEARYITGVVLPVDGGVTLTSASR